jgi:mRNA-degrading endonuclease RelE of RelBE toxin-antitoxin system
MYTIRMTAEAMRALRAIPSPIGGYVSAAVQALATDPRPAGCEPMGGDDYRISSWGYVIEYTINKAEIYIRVFYL